MLEFKENYTIRLKFKNICAKLTFRLSGAYLVLVFDCLKCFLYSDESFVCIIIKSIHKSTFFVAEKNCMVSFHQCNCALYSIELKKTKMMDAFVVLRF